MDFMKNEEGKIKYYDTEEDARIACGMYELDNVWVAKLIYYRTEDSLLYRIMADNGTFTVDDLRNIATNYALTCQNGYEGDFDNWFNEMINKTK